MSIINLSLPALTASGNSHTGTFSTDAIANVSTTLTSSASTGSTQLVVADTTGWVSGAEWITLQGGGPAGADAFIGLTGLKLFAANTLNVQNQSVVTTCPAGRTVTKWEPIWLRGTPKHVRLTRDNGDYWDYVQGMEPYSVNSSVGGVTGLLTGRMLVAPGAIHFAPSFLIQSANYSILIEY